jgi:co-chaperonin GroES (HSP10)
MIEAPANKLIVHPKTKYARNITDLMKRSAIQNGATVDPADIVNITGEILSIPKTISQTKDYEGFSIEDIQIGDIGIFSYRVIYDLIIKQENGEPVYKNLIKYNGKEYFSCDIRNLFGVIRDGEIIMVNGFVMLTEYEPKRIILSANLKNQKEATSSTIMHIGNSKQNTTRINANQSDTVYYNSSLAQHYNINDKKFIILTQDKILGREIVE